MGGFSFGGPDRIRTDDPYNANVMRSQLRYRPNFFVGGTLPIIGFVMPFVKIFSTGSKSGSATQSTGIFSFLFGRSVV